MKNIKRARVGKIIHSLAAEFVRDEAGRLSLITVTRVELSPTGKEVKIFFTTLPESKEDTALKFLVRKTPEFKKSMRAKSRIGTVPYVDFKIDYGERNRQRLDELSR